MTQIDFLTNIGDTLRYCCRLVRKARAANHQLVVLTRSSEEMTALDRALWTFSDQDFLPHATAGEALAARTPVILTDDDRAELPHHDILVNLSDRTPEHFARFQRMIEIISRDAEDVLAGRRRYRFYKERGYPLTHTEAEKT